MGLRYLQRKRNKNIVRVHVRMFCRSPTKKHLSFLFDAPRVFPRKLPAAALEQQFSTHFLGEKPVLVRDFIHSALYDPKHGYFSQHSGAVGVLERSIKFNQLNGRKAYIKHLDEIYRDSDISWFTPVELFKELQDQFDGTLYISINSYAKKSSFSSMTQPWYAHGIAEAILRTTNLSVPLKIYEIGGGSGTCAKGVLDYMKLNAPDRVYNSMTYTSVEISPTLAKIQRETVGQVSSHLSKFRVENRDAADRSGWGEVQQQPCWVIMLEVLDNLPHDLVYAENQVSPWMEVWVQKQNERETLSEVYKPLQDPLITRCLEILNSDEEQTPNDAVLKARGLWSKIFPKPRRSWLPTGCLRLLDVLHGVLPKMSLIASDFSYLPDVKIPGERAPLVSTKKEGTSSDYGSYLEAKGDADIFFPTDFLLLERMDHFCSRWPKLHKDKSSKQGKKRRVITLDTSAFMEEFGLPTKTRTRDGYNPLLDDFKNTKFYLSVPTHNIK